MDFPSATLEPLPTLTASEAGLDALLLDIQVMSALLFGDTPRPRLSRDQAA